MAGESILRQPRSVNHASSARKISREEMRKLMSIKSGFELFTTRIRPTIEHIEEANRQTDYMIKQLKSMVAEDERFTLERVLQAGSNAKHTSLRRTEENVFDVDLGAYYSGEGATRERLGTLLTFTMDGTRDIYPAKRDRKSVV